MLELWFDFSCPYAYLASRRAPALARAAGVPLAWKPMLLGGVFRGIGAGDGPMATLGAAKAAANIREMYRWAEVMGVPFQLPAAHPMRTVRALRILLGLPYSRWPAAIDAFYAAYWQRAEDITQDATLVNALRQAGVSEDDIAGAIGRADGEDIKQDLRTRTDEAMALGVFGAPAWVIRREGKPHLLAWGQDRLPWVEAMLAGWDPEAGPPGGPRPFGVGVQGFASPSTLDVYFDVASPFSYYALTQLPALAATCGVTPRLRPILLGALFRQLGQHDVPLHAMPAPKQRYIEREMAWWPTWLGIPYQEPAKFPQRTIAPQRLIVVALAEGGYADAIRLAIALGRAMWGERRILEDEATLAAILAEQQLPAAWLARTQEPAIKAELAAHTAAAANAGVFGVPSFVVDERYLFWGQDRLEHVMRALGGWRPAAG